MFEKIDKSFFPQTLINKIRDFNNNYLGVYALKSYSQEGEDMILRRIFEGKKKGFYVDIGAYHPKRFSNTYYFYKKGWSGINVDAMPGSMKLFNRWRSRDINLEVAVAKEKKIAKFYIFNEPALNSFDQKLPQQPNNGSYYIVQEQLLRTIPLAEILDEYLPHKQEIDYLSVDVEGSDLDVLQSNDWERFRPRYILVECLDTNMEAIQENAIYQFLREKHYDLFAKTINTLFFSDGSRD
jgi:FkbM family methyltransferase